MAEQRFAYNYAEIDLETNMCVGICSQTVEATEPGFVEIPELLEDYLFKYYINGNWYEDAEGTIPWTPPTE